jgi:hypothetical protein
MWVLVHPGQQLETKIGGKKGKKNITYINHEVACSVNEKNLSTLRHGKCQQMFLVLLTSYLLVKMYR